ncbi:unnamed protein product, partial [Brassica rapa subsp. narinosa]
FGFILDISVFSLVSILVVSLESRCLSRLESRRLFRISRGKCMLWKLLQWRITLVLLSKLTILNMLLKSFKVLSKISFCLRKLM